VDRAYELYALCEVSDMRATASCEMNVFLLLIVFVAGLKAYSNTLQKRSRMQSSPSNPFNIPS
jgi:hypothetical protein